MIAVVGLFEHGCGCDHAGMVSMISIRILIAILEYAYVHNQDVSNYNGGWAIKIMNDIEPRRTVPNHPEPSEPDQSTSSHSETAQGIPRQPKPLQACPIHSI